MLTGLIPPTEGDAFVDGFSITENTDLVRKSLGVCWQHDALFDFLSGREHLQLYAALKGVPAKDIKAKAEQMLVSVGLEREHWDKITKSYSGGMKRKLSFGLALIGSPKIVFLDEISSGCDPVSRRVMWDLLQKIKHDTLVVLTTHFMEEADILGDRVAIMSHGRLQCSGSSMFLKSRFGIGHYLTLVKDQAHQGQGHGVSSTLEDLITQFIPKATIHTESYGELVFLLPLESRPAFPPLLQAIEQGIAGSSLGVDGYGISMTTLEDIFLKLASKDDGHQVAEQESESYSDNQDVVVTFTEDKRAQGKNGYQRLPLSNSDEMDDTPSVFQRKRRGNGVGVSFFQQFRALLKKKFKSFIRDRSYIAVVLVPIAFILFSLLLQKVATNLATTNLSTDPVTLNPSNADPKSIPWTSNFSSSTFTSPLGDSPENLLSHVNLTDLLVEKKSVDDLEDYLLSNDTDLRTFGGYVFNEINYSSYVFDYVVLFNKSSVDSLPSYLNMMNTAIMQTIMSNSTALKDSPSDYMIKTINHPLKAKSTTLPLMGISFSIFLSLILVVGVFPRDISKENTGLTRWLLHLAGMRSLCYWAATLFADFLLYMIPLAASWGLLYAFDQKAYMVCHVILFLVGKLICCREMALLFTLDCASDLT